MKGLIVEKSLFACSSCKDKHKNNSNSVWRINAVENSVKILKIVAVTIKKRRKG
jgi:hypothetical protein